LRSEQVRSGFDIKAFGSKMKEIHNKQLQQAEHLPSPKKKLKASPAKTSPPAKARNETQKATPVEEEKKDPNTNKSSDVNKRKQKITSKESVESSHSAKSGGHVHIEFALR